MSNPAPAFLQPVKGCQISYADWNQFVTSAFALAGYGIMMQQGVTDAVPVLQPLTIATPGGMVLNLGGSSSTPQYVLCHGALCAATSVQSYTVPNNPSSAPNRLDAICIQPALVQTGTVSRPVENDSGAKPATNIPVVINGLAYQYVAGPNGGGAPTIPSGWEYFATVTVAQNAVAITASNIQINFPLMSAGNDLATTTTAAITVPSIGSTVTIPVSSTAAFAARTYGYLIDSTGKSFLFRVVSVSAGSLNVTVKAALNSGPGNPILAGAAVGISGPVPPDSSTVRSGFTSPALGSTVSIAIGTNVPFVVGSVILIGVPGSGQTMLGYVTFQDPIGDHLTVKNIGPYPFSAVTFPSDTPVLLLNDAPGAVYTTSDITVPNLGLGTTINIPVQNAQPFTPGSYGTVTGPQDTNAFHFYVNSITGNTLNVSALVLIAGQIGLTLHAGGTVIPCGAPQNDTAIVRTDFTVPSVGSLVTVAVTSNLPFPVGSMIQFSDLTLQNAVAMLGYVTGQSADGVHVTVKNLGPAPPTAATIHAGSPATVALAQCSAYTTADATVPNLGPAFPLTVGVTEATAFCPGGYVAIYGVANVNAIAGLVTSLTSNTITMMVLDLLVGTIGGLLSAGSLVVPTGTIPITESRLSSVLTIPAIGATATTTVRRNLLFSAGRIILIGSDQIGYMYGLVTAQNIDGVTITVQNLGGTAIPGSTLGNTVPVRIINSVLEKNGGTGAAQAQEFRKFAHITAPGVGGTATITFDNSFAFTGTSTYTLQITPQTAGATFNVTKSSTGFTLTQTGSVNSAYDWYAVGW